MFIVPQSQKLFGVPWKTVPGPCRRCPGSSLTARAMRRLLLGVVLLSIGLWAEPGWGDRPSAAKTQAANGKLAFALDLPSPDRFRVGAIPPDSAIIASYNISQYGLQVPSLWWTHDQFGGKLLELWLAYPAEGDDPAWVDLLVNEQIWSLLNYLERYTFLKQFGSAAQADGFSTRVFNPNGTLLATYFCTFPPNFPADTPDQTPHCITAIGFNRSVGFRGGDTMLPNR